MKDQKKSNFKNNYLLSIGEILSRIPMIFTIGYLAKSVGPEAFGAWSLVLVLQTLLTALGGAGLGTALMRYGPNASKDVAYQYIILSINKSAVFLAVLSVFVYVFNNNIGALLNIKVEYQWLLMVSCVMTMGSILDSHLDKYFKARILINKQITYLFIRTFAEVIAVISVFYFMSFSHVSNAIFSYILVVVSIKLIIYPWLILEKKLIKRNKVKLKNKDTFLNFSYLLVPSILLAWIIIQTDRIILGWMLSPIELGVYAFSATLASYIVFISYSIMPLFQSLSTLYYDKGEFQRLRNLYEIWQYLYISAATILMIILVFLSKEILSLTAGEEYSKLPHILLWLSAGVAVDQLFGQHQLIFNLAEKPKLSTLVNSIKLLSLVGLIPCFVYLYGINGAVLGLMVSVIIVNIVRYKIAIKLIDIRITFFVKMYLTLSIVSIILFSYMHHLNFMLKSSLVIISILSFIIFFIVGQKKLSERNYF